MATFETLSAAVNWRNGLPPGGSTVAIVGSGLESEGSAMIPHFISSTFSMDGGSVVLVSFRQAFSHYMHILRKMGVNATKHKISFVDALTNTDLSTLPMATRPNFTLTQDNRAEFYDWLGQQKAHTVVIDGLCSLLDQGNSTGDAIEFLRTCQRIVNGAGGVLVANVLLDEFSELLVQSLVRRAHFVFSVDPLASGASNDVSGQLTVVPGHLHCQIRDRADEFRPALLHYHVSDTTVRFFSPGQSSTVL